MIYKKPKTRKRPYWASPRVWEHTTGVVTITLFGAPYELPVMAETKPFLAVLEGALDPWGMFRGKRSEFIRQEIAQDGLRTIIQALYAQIEAHAIASAAEELKNEIGDRLAPLIHAKVRARVEEKKVRTLSLPDNGNEPGEARES